MKKLSIKELKEKRKKKGFTLIELIIVIAIIAILAAMAIPKFGEIRESANTKADIATGKNIATAVATAIADGETLPNDQKVTKGGSDVVSKKLDGDLVGKAKKGKGMNFSYDVDADGNIKVSYGDSYNDNDEVYPEYNSGNSSTSTTP